MKDQRASKPRVLIDVSHPCWTGEGFDFDHEWKYDGGDYSVGLNPGWECETCGEVDIDREPPSYDDDY